MSSSRRQPLIDHENAVDGFLVRAKRADVIEDAIDRPVLANRHVVRSHQAADAVFGEPEQEASFREVFRLEQRQRPLHDRAGQLCEQVSTIVGRQRREELSRFLVRQVAKKRVLVVPIEVREGIRRLVARQCAKQQHPLGLRHLQQQPRHVVAVQRDE
jgi:hypothetical protein